MVFIRLLSILFEKTRRLRGKANDERWNQAADVLAKGRIAFVEERSYHFFTKMSVLLACAKL